MKVYVSELPKACYCCPFYDENVVYGNSCLFGENKETCHLQSLSDYTKQVRKEVVQEFREKLKNNIYLTRDRKHWIAYQDDLLEILDQIQGE